MLDTIKTLKDPGAAEGVIGVVTTERGKVIEALKVMGPGAEPAVLQMLRHTEESVRVEACHVLQVIGTRKSLPILEELIKRANGQGGVASAAREAIEAMASLPTEERRPPDADFDSRVLYDLKSPTLDRRREAVNRLTHAPPDESRRVEVARAVEPMLGAIDAGARGDAARVLRVWGGKTNTKALVAVLRDPDGGVRSAALDALGSIKDPASAVAVAALIPTDRGKVIETLKAIGPVAERAAIPYLDNPDVFLRADICRPLGVIGTHVSAAALGEVVQRTNGEGFDGSFAREAIQAIRNRGGN